MLKRPALAEHLMKNVFFDTCVYHQAGILEKNARRVFPRLDALLKSTGR
jgi:hypothetical protein